MKQCELQKTISQLFNALKSHFFACALLSDGFFQTIGKIIFVVNVITLELYVQYFLYS